MGGRTQRYVLILAVVATAVVLSLEAIPLGVPGEWTWPRNPVDLESLVGGLLAAIAGGLYLFFAYAGACRIVRGRSLERAAWLVSLVLAGFAFQWICIQFASPPLGYARVPWVLYYPRSSGYFWQARYEVEDTTAFLAEYEDLMAERDYLHIGTHPPGLTLAYRGMLAACHHSEPLTDALLATQPPSFSEAINTLEASQQPGGRSILAPDSACLWLAALLTQLASVATAAGIYGLAARYCDRKTAWMAACLWPLIPATIVFFPKSDTLYPLIGVTTGWLWLTACDNRSVARGFLSGVTFWLGMMLSLAFLTIAALLGAMTIWESVTRWKRDADAGWFLSLNSLGAAAAGLALPTAFLALVYDINLLSVWSWNLANHALFYDHNPRTWWIWTLVNPAELAFAIGLPVAAACGWGFVRLFRSSSKYPRAAVAVALLLVWGGLWLSGKNMGEAARLWILLMPWFLLVLGSSLADEKDTLSSAGDSDQRGLWWTLAGTQLVASVITVSRVDGFHFAELLAG